MRRKIHKEKDLKQKVIFYRIINKNKLLLRVKMNKFMG